MFFFVNVIDHIYSVESTLRNMRVSQTEQIHLALSLPHPSMRCTVPNRGKTSERGFTVRSWRLLLSELSNPTLTMDFRALHQTVLDQGVQVNL